MQENRSGGRAKGKTRTDYENSWGDHSGQPGGERLAAWRAENGTASMLLKPGSTTTANGTTFVRPPDNEAGLWQPHAWDSDPLGLLGNSGDARYAHGQVAGAVKDERVYKQGGILQAQLAHRPAEDVSALRSWQPESGKVPVDVAALLRLLGLAD